jgi:hypothetical protein
VDRLLPNEAEGEPAGGPPVGLEVAAEGGAAMSAKSYPRADVAAFSNVPPEMREDKYWTCWRAVPKGDKVDKVPVDVKTLRNQTGEADDMPTWSFEDACACLVSHPEKVHGVGFRFTKRNPYCGTDLDHVRDAASGELTPYAAEIAARFPTYTEASPSGTGLHIICRGKIPRNVPKTNGVELYDHGRFFTVTGNILPGSPSVIADCTEQVLHLFNELNGGPSNGNRGRTKTAAVECKIPKGSQDNWLTSQAGVYRKRGDGAETIEKKLLIDYHERCAPPHDNEKRVREIARGITRYESGDSLPEILIRAGEVPQAADQAEEVLLEHARRLGIFQRGGELVKVIRHAEDRAPRKDSKLRIPEGALKLKPFSEPMVKDALERIINFMKWDARSNKNVRCDCPERLATNYLSRGTWRLPHLAGTITAPLLRHDGSLLSAPGYDEETRLYLQSDCEWLPLADEPTQEDARAALEILCAPFAEFPFVADEDRAVVIAAILTALQRRLLMFAPAFAFSAPQPRTGKSHLAEAPALLALGHTSPAFAVSSEGEELRKAFTAILREAYPIINLDNIERPLRSPELCKILTQETYGDRLLGETSTLSLPTNCTWTMTGNNLVFRGDLAQRVLLCRIDARVPNPEQRSFAIPEIKAHLLEHRAEFVHAALTILRAYHVAGRPKQDCPNWGGFEDWSAQIREPLIWARMADPFKTREAAITEDPEMESATVAMRELARAFKDRSFTANEAVDAANDEIVDAHHHQVRHVDPELHTALAAITRGRRKDVDLNDFGFWLRKWKDRFAGSRQLTRANSTKSRVTEWKINEK